jgi:hypothetical protein
VSSQTPSQSRILEPASTCRSCIESLDDLDWRAASSFRIGEWALGVRSSTAEFDAALRRILAAHVTDVEAPANFSALVHHDADGARRFHFLYRASDSLVRTRTPWRVLRTLLNHLSDFASPDASVPKVEATAFVVDGRAVVAPERVRIELPAIETRLNDAGLMVVDTPVLHIDPASRELVVPELALSIDIDALADFDRDHAVVAREPSAVAPGRYPIAAWSFVAPEQTSTRLGHAQAVAAAAQDVVNAAALGAPRVLEDLAAVLGAVPARGLAWRTPDELARGLIDLADRSA